MAELMGVVRGTRCPVVALGARHAHLKIDRGSGTPVRGNADQLARGKLEGSKKALPGDRHHKGRQ